MLKLEFGFGGERLMRRRLLQFIEFLLINEYETNEMSAGVDGGTTTIKTCRTRRPNKTTQDVCYHTPWQPKSSSFSLGSVHNELDLKYRWSFSVRLRVKSAGFVYQTYRSAC